VRTDPEERTLVKLPSGEAILRTFKRLVIGLLAVGLAHSEALPGSAATTLPDIRGIYIVAQKGWLDDGQLAQAIAVPGVDGILVYVLWSVLTSAKAPPKTYNWTVLDQMVQLAVSNGKKFEVGIVTGRDTPAWVFDAPPQGLGAAGQTFGYVQLGKPGAGCLRVQLALPWDNNYIAAYADLLQQLSTHLKAQSWYNSMTMLRLTGINTYTEELRLPAEPPGTGAAAQSCLSGNLQAWEQVGYTQGLVATGWRQMLTASQRAFPDKTFNLALITDNGFPAFLPNGTPVSSPAAAVQQASLVIVTNLAQITAQQFPGQLVIQSNGLEDQGLLDTTTIQLAQQNGTLLAWQTNESELQTGGAACGGTRAMPMVCTSDADYFNLLKLGIFPEGSSGTNPVMAQYLELLPPNVIAFPNAVLQAHNILLPGPTPVTAPTLTPAPKATFEPTSSMTPELTSGPTPTTAPKSERLPSNTPTFEPPSTPAPKPIPKS